MTYFGIVLVLFTGPMIYYIYQVFYYKKMRKGKAGRAVIKKVYSGVFPPTWFGQKLEIEFRISETNKKIKATVKSPSGNLGVWGRATKVKPAWQVGDEGEISFSQANPKNVILWNGQEQVAKSRMFISAFMTCVLLLPVIKMYLERI